MTLPYPLLARGKIIDTDMSLGQNYAPGLEGAEKIEALERRIKAYQESEMSNAVAVRNQVVLTLFPLLKDGVSIEDGISRATLISDFILNGSTSVYEEADLRLKLLNGYEQIRQLLNDLGVPIPILESTSSVWEHTLHALVAYLEKCPPSAGK